MRKKITIMLIISMLCASLCGCANEKATITTTVYAVKYLVEQLAGDKVNVEYISTDEFIQRANIVDNYDEIFQRTTLFLYINGLEPYLDIYTNITEKYDNIEVIDLASLSAIYDFKRYTAVTVNDVTIIKESDYYQSSLFDYTDVYDKDPFIWLDPIAMSSMASTIKDWLEKYDPEDTLIFENNFKELQTKLIRMDAEYQSLNQLENVKMVTVSATFGNWQKLYGVEVYPLILSKYGVLPTDQQLEYIEEVIKANNVKYIAYDDTLPEDMQQLYQKVKDDLKLTEIKISSLSKLSEEAENKSKEYMTIMYENLTAIENAFKK